MGGMFSSPKSVKPPPPPPIEPPPVIKDTGVEDAERRKIRRRKGRKETVITGELTPEEGKKRTLG